MKKKEKKKINIKTKDIDELAEFIKENNKEKILNLCKKLGINNLNEEAEFNEDYIYYEIIGRIENDEFLVYHFRKIAIKNESLYKLFKYFKKPKNIRYFIDNKEKYKLSNENIEIMYDYFKKRYNQYNRHQDDVNVEYKWSDAIIMLIACALGIVFFVLVVFSMKSYFFTEIIKSANITEAKVIELKREKTIFNKESKNVRIKYEYNVDGIKYSKDNERLTDVSLNINSINSILIFYDINNPSKSEVLSNSFNIRNSFQYKNIVFR